MTQITFHHFLGFNSLSFFVCVLLNGTVCTDKGAQGVWCVTHSTWCTTSAVTCDKVNKVHKGGTKCLKITIYRYFKLI